MSDEVYCGDCGDICVVIFRDEGYGPTYYGDSWEWHHDYVAMSACCNADVFWDEELEIPADSLTI